MLYLVVYDIADPRRLVRVARVLEDYGLRVQLSVFEAELEPSSLATLQARLGGIIDPAEDGVKFFPLCAGCLQRIEVYGQGTLPEAQARFLVF